MVYSFVVSATRHASGEGQDAAEDMKRGRKRHFHNSPLLFFLLGAKGLTALFVLMLVTRISLSRVGLRRWRERSVQTQIIEQVEGSKICIVHRPKKIPKYSPLAHPGSEGLT